MLRNISLTAMTRKTNRSNSLVGLNLTDLHSHILPEIDDGSVNTDESIQMLKKSHESGVGMIIATPHFYPDLNTPEHFFAKRSKSVETLLEVVDKERGNGEIFPKIGLGAEVAFFKGMSRSDTLESFCIKGTRLILIEMPFGRWNDSIIDELYVIKASLGLVPVIAHIDRYIQYQDSDSFSEIFAGDFLIQANASAFESSKSAKKVLNMLKDGEIDFLGSDCHNTTDRSPDISRAISIIEKKLGKDAIEELKKFGNYALSEAVCII